MMKLLISAGFSALLLAGCVSPYSDSLLAEMINVSETDEAVQSFIEDALAENGAYLYTDDGDKTYYVFLNGRNVNQGEEAFHFSDFTVKAAGDTLNVNYQSESTADYSSPDLDFTALYEIMLDKDYGTVEIFENGSEGIFHAVSGE